MERWLGGETMMVGQSVLYLWVRWVDEGMFWEVVVVVGSQFE